MNDDRLISSLRRIAEPVEPSSEFLDHLYEGVAKELGFRGEPAADSVPWPRRRGRPRPQRGRVLLWLAAAVLLALALLGGVALVGALLEHRTTQDPSAAGTCSSWRTVIAAALSGAAVPEEAMSVRAPEGGRIAMALEDQPTPLATITSGSIVVAGPEAGSARVIATFSGDEIMRDGGVGIFSWSASGDSLLVYAGSDSTLSGDRICGNLWLLQADGSAVTRLTDNGPTQAIDQAAFSPSSASVAYVQANVLHILDLAGGEQTIPIGQCQSYGPHRLHWAPTERKVLLVCDRQVVALDRDTGTARSTSVPGGLLLDAVWSSDSQAIVAATAEDGGPVTILDIDAAEGSTVTRARSDHSSTWLGSGQTLSPDGRWLLVRGDVDVPDSESPTYRIDTATGPSSKLPWPVVADSWFFNSLGGVPAVTWLEGNDRVLAADGETLYEVDLRALSRTEVGSVVPNQDWAVFMIPR